MPELGKMYLLDDDLEVVRELADKPRGVSSPLPSGLPPSQEMTIGDYLAEGSRAVEKYITEPGAAVAEATAALVTGLTAFPVSGWAGLQSIAEDVHAKDEIDWEKAQQQMAQIASYMTYAPRTELGQWLTDKAGWLLELPARGTRWFGGKMVEWGVPPAVAAIITTPMEFLLYAALFRKAHGILPKGADKAGIKLSDVEAADKMIRAAIVEDRTLKKAQEAKRVQEAEAVKAPERVEGLPVALSKEALAELMRVTKKYEPVKVTAEELAGIPKPKAEFIGYQETATGEQVPLYNVGKDTLTADTLRKRGIEVPETPPPEAPTGPKPSEVVREGLEAGKTREDLARELYGEVTEETLGRVGDVMADQMLAEKATAVVTYGEGEAHMASIAERCKRWRQGDETIDIDALEREALDLYQSDTKMSSAEMDVFLDRSQMLLDIVRKAKRSAQNRKAGVEEPSTVRAKADSVEPEQTNIVDPTGKGFSTEGAAEMWNRAWKLDGEVISNPDGEGFVIRTKEGFTAVGREMAESKIGYGAEEFRKGIKGALDKVTDESGRAQILEDFSKFLGETVSNLRGWFRMKDWPDVTSETYKTVQGAVEDLRINRNLAAFDAQDVRESILRALPELSEREACTLWQERPDIQLGPEATTVSHVAKEVYKRYREKLANAGILNEFIENYVNHIIKDITKPATSWIRRRSRTTEGFPTSIEELEARGYVVEKDIAQLLPSYIYYAEQALAKKAFTSLLKDLKTPDGKFVLLPRSQVLPELRDVYVPIDDAMLRTWTRFGRRKARKAAGDAVIDAERKRLFREPTSIHRDAFKLVENILSDRSSETYGKLAQTRSVIKRIIMYNPLIHGWNIESNVLMSLGKDYPIRFRSLNEQQMQGLLRRMVKNGVELEGLFDVSKRLGADIYELKAGEKITFEDLIHDPRRVLKHPIKGARDLGDVVLWDRWVKTGQVAIFDTLEQRFMKAGLGPDEAGRAAAMMTNDLMGTIPSTWFTKAQRRALRTLLFARNWNVSNFRTLTGALGRGAKAKVLPKYLRFEGMTDAQLKTMGRQYRYVLLKGVVGIVTTSNMIQAAFLKAQGQDFHPTWQNEKDHWFDIDTGMIDKKGRKIYLKNWLFRQIDDYRKFMSSHIDEFARAKMEPLLRTCVEILFNVNYLGQPIRERGAPALEQLEATGRYAVKGVTPLDVFLGREDEVRTWLEALAPLTGTWVRHGLPAGGSAVAGDMLREYYDWSAETKYADREAKKEVDKLIKLGKNREAADRTFALMQEGQLSAEQFGNIVRQLADPLWFRVTSSPSGKLKKDFVEFLLSLNREERDKYLKELGKLKAGGAMKPSVPSQLPPEVGGRMEVVGVE